MKKSFYQKLFLVIFPLFILFFIHIFKPSQEIVISNIKNINCEDIIKIGSKISSINDIDIKSIKDFENIKNKIKTNQTFFIILDNKIIKCKALDNFEINVTEISRKIFLEPINFKRFILEKNEKNLKFLNFLGYKNYIIDLNEIIIPYDEKLYLLLNLERDLSFYLERDLEKENETVRLVDKLVSIEDLYKMFDEVVIKEKNITVRKYLFNQDFIEDFDFKIKHFYPVSFSITNITFKLNSEAKKILSENLKEIPIKLIHLEKYYDAKIVIKFKNISILTYYLPYKDYENYISLQITNLDDVEEIKKFLTLQIFKVKEIKEEKYFKIFSIDIFSFFIFLIIFSFGLFKTKEINFLYYIPLIFSSLFFPLIIPLLSLIIFLSIYFLEKKISLRLVIFTIFSFIFSLLYYQKVFFSLSLFFLSVTFSYIFLISSYYYKKFEIIIFVIFLTFSLFLFFLNVPISFSLLLAFFVNILMRMTIYI